MAFLGLSSPMCLGCVLGLVLGLLSASGGPLAAIVVRLGVVLRVLVFLVVIAVLLLLRIAVLLLLLSLGQSLRVRKLLCHANATRSGDQFGNSFCNGVTRIAFLQNDSDFPGTYLFIPDPFLIAPGSDNGPKATNGE